MNGEVIWQASDSSLTKEIHACKLVAQTKLCKFLFNFGLSSVQVSSLLSNFFVAAYGLINLCVVHVSLTKSPSWRPKYKYYSVWASLAGTILCVIVMFMMDWKTALATYIIITLLCIAIQKNKPDANWGSSTQSQVFLTALKGVHNLTKVEDHIKNYRPKVRDVLHLPARAQPC